jgi:hypothetical protein
MTKQYRSRELPPLQKMIALEAAPENDNSLLKAGMIEPITKFTYGDLMNFQRSEGKHYAWHERVV